VDSKYEADIAVFIGASKYETEWINKDKQKLLTPAKK